MYCTKCGEQILGDPKFCSQCGTKVKEEQEKVTVEQTSKKYKLHLLISGLFIFFAGIYMV